MIELSPDLAQRIRQILQDHSVVLFMKGTQQHPMCGFSRQVVRILERLDVPFHGVDILQDDELRQGLKIFSDWPTFPQLYGKGELVGGCDIVSDLDQKQELKKILGLEK